MIPGKYHGYPPGITRENGFFKNLNLNLKFKIFINFCRHFMHGNALWGWGDVSLNKWPLALALVYFLNDSL